MKQTGNSIIGDDGYNKNVIGLGDTYSGNFKDACDKANKNTHSIDSLKKEGNTWKVITGEYGTELVTESIDGVGTKIQIYSEVFNSMVEDYLQDGILEEELIEMSVELWERMLSDLIAMNVDDLRDGEIAVAVTNIIDINHLEGPRGKFFAESMKIALGNVIRETGICMTAGETAILGENEKVPKIVDEVTEPQKVAGITSLSILDILLNNKKVRELLNEDEDLKDYLEYHVAKNGDLVKYDYISTSALVDQIVSNSIKECEKLQKRLDIILKDISFNIGGTGLGVKMEGNELSKIKKGQIIVYLQEKPTKNGIIGPRSNGITRIRTGMEKLAGKRWENLTFEEFLEKIGEEQSSKLSEKLKDECKGLKMWDIATGKTTVFNHFVSYGLLGGESSPAITEVSSLIHVTGNPGRKISEGLRGNNNLAVDLDISEVKIPQIIEILQILGSIEDGDAIGSWNMGVPYAFICNEDDLQDVIDEACNFDLVAGKIGEVVERKDENIAGVIKGVGIGKSEIIYT